jgi:predicted metal-binding membrane protein
VAESPIAGRGSAFALPLRERVVIWLCVIGVTALAWTYLVRLGQGMAPAMPAGAMTADMGMAMDAPWALREVAFLFWMWAVMMVGMMAPSATPVLLLFAGLQARRTEGRAPFAVSLFALGYAIVWIGFCACAALAQWALHDTAVLSAPMNAASGPVGGAILCAAGAYQLLPFKGVCLARCRSPVSFLVMHWRDGALGALSMGARHGVWCLGCCWALMAVLFAVGVMNLVWVAALALFVLVEKTGPAGVAIGRAGSVMLLAAGVLMLVIR